MNNLPDWSTPQKPSELAYRRLVQSILDGSLPANSMLPNEHELAVALGVTRSTLREALQKLSANGLVEIQHGKPTRVRDIWVEGNMNTLSTIIEEPHTSLTTRWVPQILEVRAALAPRYTFLAVEHNAPQVAAVIDRLTAVLTDDENAFSLVDWDLHHLLTVLSTNPIYTLILNGFKGYYHVMAVKYFALPEARQYSRQFYDRLKEAALAHNPEVAGNLASDVMRESINFWEKTM